MCRNIEDYIAYKNGASNDPGTTVLPNTTYILPSESTYCSMCSNGKYLLVEYMEDQEADRHVILFNMKTFENITGDMMEHYNTLTDNNCMTSGSTH